MKHMDIPPYDKTFFPRKPNYSEHGDYLISRKVTRMLDASCRKHEPGDNAARSVDAQCCLAQRELDATEKKLSDRRSFLQAERDRLKKKWAKLETKELELRNSFKKFDQVCARAEPFVKENYEKRERAAVKTVEHRRLWQERREQIDSMLSICVVMQTAKQRMDKTIKEYSLYENFLNEVLASEMAASCINDIIIRYETLLLAKKELDVIQREYLQHLENSKLRMQQKVFDFYNKVEGLKIKLYDLENRYEKAVENSQKWEKIHGNIKMEAIERVIKTIGIKQACLKMYLEICKRKKVSPRYVENFEKQFIYIKNAIGEYEGVNKMVVAQKEKEQKVSLKPHVSAGSSKS